MTTMRVTRLQARIARIKAKHAEELAAGTEPMAEAKRFLLTCEATIKTSDPAVMAEAVDLVEKCASDLLQIAVRIGGAR